MMSLHHYTKVPVDKRTEEPVSVEKRVEILIESVMETVFFYIASGLFERHKLIVASQLTMMVGAVQARPWLEKHPVSQKVCDF